MALLLNILIAKSIFFVALGNSLLDTTRLLYLYFNVWHEAQLGFIFIFIFFSLVCNLIIAAQGLVGEDKF